MSKSQQSAGVSRVLHIPWAGEGWERKWKSAGRAVFRTSQKPGMGVDPRGLFGGNSS